MMKRLHRKVNIVVVIAKADTLTAAEVKRLKTRILNDLEENQIQVCNLHLFLSILFRAMNRRFLFKVSRHTAHKICRYAVKTKEKEMTV